MNVPNGHRGHDRGRRRAPRLEVLEARDLPTFAMVHHPAALATGGLAALQARTAVHADAQGGSVANPVASAGDTTGVLTPHEVRREQYVARFKGSYRVGPGRTTAQAAQLSSLGYGGGNQSFHLWSNMRIVLPTDPNAPVVGTLYMISWNVGTTGTQLILDLTGDKSTEVNGIPTHYTWTVDPTSAGLYTTANGYGTGAGTLDIQFFRPTHGAGQLQFAVNGLIDTGGIFNDIGVLGNTPSRP